MIGDESFRRQAGIRFSHGTHLTCRDWRTELPVSLPSRARRSRGCSDSAIRVRAATSCRSWSPIEVTGNWTTIVLADIGSRPARVAGPLIGSSRYALRRRDGTCVRALVHETFRQVSPAAPGTLRFEDCATLQGVEDLHESRAVSVILPDVGQQPGPLLCAAQRLQDRPQLPKIGRTALVC